MKRIATAAQLLIKKGIIPAPDPAVAFPLVPAAATMPLPNAMFEEVLAEERKAYELKRNTTPADLESVIYRWLLWPVHQVLNVMGELTWHGEERVPSQFDRILPDCVELHRCFSSNPLATIEPESALLSG